MRAHPWKVGFCLKSSILFVPSHRVVTPCHMILRQARPVACVPLFSFVTLLLNTCDLTHHTDDKHVNPSHTDKHLWLHTIYTMWVGKTSETIILYTMWPCGLVGKASEYGSEDRRFESGRGQTIFIKWNVKKRNIWETINQLSSRIMHPR